MTTNDAKTPDSAIRRRWILALLPLILPVGLFIYNSYVAIDFGYHWDEPFMVGTVQESTLTGDWLRPRAYNYPSMSYWVSVIGALPTVLTASSTDEAIAQLADPAYLLQVRRLFTLGFALAVVCVYLTLLTLYNRISVALLGAGLVAFSWEIGYHARWLAPDAWVTGFAALTMLFTVLAIKNTERRRWLYLAAVAGGLTVASKYNAAIIGVMILGAALVVWRANAGSPRQLVALLVRLGLASLVTFLVITPGALIDTADMLENIRYEIHHYSERGHFNHTVTPGWQHLSLMLTYFIQVVFSPETPIALFFAALVPLGAFALWRPADDEDAYQRLFMLAVVAFVTIYLLYMASQRVMFVRNVLVLIPPLAVLSAAGFYRLWRWMRPRPVAYALAGVVALMIAFNAAWTFDTARTITTRTMDDYAADAYDFIASNPDTVVCTSWLTNVMLTYERDYVLPGSVQFSMDVDYIMYMGGELDPTLVDANRPDLTVRWFGPNEVNYNYYPGWLGEDRFVIVRADDALEHNIVIPQCVDGVG